MKTLLNTILMMAALTASAASNEIVGEEAEIKNVSKLSCLVPVENGVPTVSVDVALSNDTSVDFVTVTVAGSSSKNVLFMQMEKGSFEEQLATGSVGMMVIEEGFSSEEGVIKKAGLLTVQKSPDATWSGLLLAMGNIYPLACELK